MAIKRVRQRVICRDFPMENIMTNDTTRIMPTVEEIESMVKTLSSSFELCENQKAADMLRSLLAERKTMMVVTDEMVDRAITAYELWANTWGWDIGFLGRYQKHGLMRVALEASIKGRAAPAYNGKKEG